MNRSEARRAVHALIRCWLGERTCLDDSSELRALGLERDDLEELLWRLEDRFGLCVPTGEEQHALRELRCVHELIEWLLEMSRRQED
ncbi:acyl carrier protein [Pseudomonas sp. KCJK8993]|uniref:acyl carrier protein n=1 Tax=Pseudomonas sp. KCJK8993 TaxID=3344565 RepID=UPI0039058AEC